MEHAIEKLKHLTLKLATDYNVTHEEIYTHIRKTLMKESTGMPLKGVLYCNSHSFFALSDHFVDYLENECNIEVSMTKMDREVIVPYMVHYGQYVLAQQSNMARVLRAYVGFGLEDIVKNIALIEKQKNDLRIFDNNMSRLDNYLKTNKQISFNYSCPPQVTALCNNYTEFKNYKSEDLQDIIDGSDETINVMEKTIENNISALSQIGKDLYLYYTTPEGVNARTVERSQQEECFVDNFNWKLQSKFYRYAVEFLLANSQITFNGDLTHDQLHDLHLRVALMCAANGCDLEIAWVPALVGWMISDYDGLETITLI